MQIITAEDYRLYGGLKRPELESGVEVMITAANALITSLLGMDDADAVDQLITTKPTRKKILFKFSLSYFSNQNDY